MTPLQLQILSLPPAKESLTKKVLQDSEGYYVVDSDGYFIMPLEYNALQTTDFDYLKDPDGFILLGKPGS